MMQDITTTSTVSPQTNNNSGFDTTVNGHDYLLSIIQLPIYLQLNLSKTKQLKKNLDGLPKRRQTVRYIFFLFNKQNLFYRFFQMVHQFLMYVQIQQYPINFQKINDVDNDEIHYQILNQYDKIY
jgi:hypothetical protein